MTAWTSWPVVMAPWDTRNEPAATTAMLARAGKQIEEGLEGSAQPADGDAGIAQAGRLGGEALDLVGLPPQRLDHQGAVEALVRHRTELAQLLLGRGPRDAPCAGRTGG